MRLLNGRHPRIDKFERKGKVERIVRALDYEDPMIDRDGHFVDLGAEVRVAAVDALGRFDTPLAHEGLVRALADPERSVRAAAVGALRERRDIAAAEALTSAVANWREAGQEGLRQRAVAALAAFDDPGSAQRLTEMLLGGGWQLSEADAESLRTLGASGGGKALQDTIDELVQSLRDERTGGRAGSLLSLLTPESVLPLVGTLGEPSMQRAVALTLGATHDSRAVDSLCALLRTSNDPMVRRAVAWALGEIRDPAAVESLLMATGDGDYEVRAAAGESFDKLGNVAVAVALSAIVRPAMQEGGSAEAEAIGSSSAEPASEQPVETIAPAASEPSRLPQVSPGVQASPGRRARPLVRRLLGLDSGP